MNTHSPIPPHPSKLSSRRSKSQIHKKRSKSTQITSTNALPLRPLSTNTHTTALRHSSLNTPKSTAFRPSKSLRFFDRLKKSFALTEWGKLKSTDETVVSEELVGTDDRGHRYFEYRNSWQPPNAPSRRRVQYFNDVMAPDNIHELWDAWLRHQRKTPPSEQEFEMYNAKRKAYLDRVAALEEEDAKLRHQEQLQKKLAMLTKSLNKQPNGDNAGESGNGPAVSPGQTLVMEIIAKMEKQHAEQREKLGKEEPKQKSQTSQNPSSMHSAEDIQVNVTQRDIVDQDAVVPMQATTAQSKMPQNDTSALTNDANKV